MFCVIAYAVGALIEESAVAWTIFLGVPLEVYLCQWDRRISGVVIFMFT